ncbi:hypothetical protein PPL_02676 [Heterostelium album PN500]|uniref:Uncharacterized protein n=1 Tax=Heterostelium pallidum (strain ATCC 26659 / Pp 5 / PN500) TaxID=670386 RepID=D3B2R2_HETP5|nr:hypothetical protein PPL_02676 [Heterostelium album PN500]EFA83610.1 hypothetical protein PPL_02676 [Heterostelium album PN500]|eukprot:XP_020435727.1 hypothetical protein PPL_02676 [Heterostelium album PN500]
MNNNKDINNSIAKFKKLYLDSLEDAFSVGNLQAINHIHNTLAKEIDYSKYAKKEYLSKI